MKKLLSFLLALTILLSAAGCNLIPSTPEVTEPVITTLPVQMEQTEPASEPETTEPPSTEAPVLVTERPQTDPPITQPPQTEPEDILPPQTDPPIPEQETQEIDTEPEETDPPQTEPEQTLPPQTDPPQTDPTDPPQPYLDPYGSYTSKNDVALYLYLYGRLPNNFITKNEADDRFGTTKVSKYGYCIGGDRFYNREGLLPSGYTYYECDIDTLYGGGRGTKRLVFTYSGLIYYTSDHYRSFTLLYGNP